MYTDILWSCERQARLNDIEAIAKRDLHKNNAFTKSNIGHLDDIFPRATPVTEEGIKYSFDGDRLKTYTNLECSKYPSSSCNEAYEALKTQSMDRYNNVQGSSPFLSESTLSQACTYMYNSVSSKMENVNPVDHYANHMDTTVKQGCNDTMANASLNASEAFSYLTMSDSVNSIYRSPAKNVNPIDINANLMETTDEQECNDIMANISSKASETFLYMSPSDSSNTIYRSPGSPESSYESSCQSILNVSACKTSHSIDKLNIFQTNVKSVKTKNCHNMPYKDFEIISKPYKIISHHLHSGGEVSKSVTSNPKTENSFKRRDLDTTLPDFKHLLHSLLIAPGYDHSMTQSHWFSQVAIPEREMTSVEKEVTSQLEPSMMISQTEQPIPAIVECVKAEDDQTYEGQRKSKTIKLKRNCRLWEYIRNLLLDPKTNPDLICWVDRAEGSFKLVNSKKIARIWGMKKGNENMNYEKLSRAIRHYYKRQVFLPVHGERLVYKFGPKAVGWKQ